MVVWLNEKILGLILGLACSLDVFPIYVFIFLKQPKRHAPPHLGIKPKICLQLVDRAIY